MITRMRISHIQTRATAIAYSLCAVIVLQSALYSRAFGQDNSPKSTEQQLQQLVEAMSRAEAQLAASQQQIIELRREVETLQHQISHENESASQGVGQSQTDKQLAQTIQDLSETQAVQQSEIATQEQSKVESMSKYPVKISGMILMNGFVNSSAVDSAPTPTVALPGGGSTGASLRQTVLGVDARGPQLYGAQSSADLRVDFYGAPGAATYNNTAGLVRLRTAHASLTWQATQIFFSLDRPILSPNAPTSLTAVAEPALAWSGNLWSWNPQLGIQHDFRISPSYRFRVQTALIDAANPPGLTLATTQPLLPTPSDSELSRKPGIQTRIALLGADNERGAAFGVGGYYSPHQTVRGYSYDAWAATVDYRLPLPARLELTGSAYRGLALGGLGGGAFKDYVFGPDPDSNSIYVQPLDDVGGWTQLKQRLTERFEWNAAYGIDNAFAGQLRPFATTTYAPYLNLARNRTFFSNVIYSPSAYLLFSFEYRHLQSSPVNSPTSPANVYGLAAAYKF